MSVKKHSVPTWFCGAGSTREMAVANPGVGMARAAVTHLVSQPFRAGCGPAGVETRTLERRYPASEGPQPLASFVERRSGLRIELHHPLESPGRWVAYLDGAESRYLAHGVERALDRPRLEDGRSTSLFFVAVDDTDRVVGGIRCHGPLRAASEAYALHELAGHPRLEVVRDTLADCIRFGLMEIKGAWVEEATRRPGLSDALARCHVHAMNWFGARFAVCSTSVSTGARWQTAGGRPMEGIAPVPYPDDRYETVLLWWDSERNEELCEPGQWARLTEESDELSGNRPAGGRGRGRRPSSPAGLPAPDMAWRPEVLDERRAADSARLAGLLAEPGIEVLDQFAGQVAALRKVRPLPARDRRDESPRWIYYPWRRCLVRLLAPPAYRALRLDRNRNKITLDEQAKLEGLRIGVVGLSVGHSIAYLLALEGICGELRLADFDSIELSNLNRIPASVLDLGINKAVAVSRRIAELDPYVKLQAVTEGLSASNIDAFIDGLDVVIEECDSLDLKLMVREAARRAGIPVIMDTSDRGLLDVERFDLEPNRPLFHGLLGDVQASDLVGLSTHDKIPYVLRILEPAQLSSRMAASMAEIDESLTTWPQLGGDVSLGAATIAAAIRRLGRGEHLPSGRVRVDVGVALDALAEPRPVDSRHIALPVPVGPPADPALAVAHAANLAPSGGNSQPWSLRLDAGRLRLLVDRTRTSTMDVAFRGSYVAIGAALLNARIAAAAHGMLGSVEQFSEGVESDLVATVNLEPGSDAGLACLYPGMLARGTNRRPGRPAPLDDGLVEELHQHVAAHGARLRLLTDRDVIEDYAELLGESDRLRYLSPVLHAEMMSELRWPGQDHLEQGIDVRTLELDEADLGKLAVARRPDVMADLAAWDGGRALGEITRDRIRSSSALALVTIPDTSPQSYVRGGGALERLWLAAEQGGLSAQPVSPLSIFAVDPADFASLVPGPYVHRLQALAARLRTLAGMDAGEALVLVLRLSHSPPATARSMRIGLQTVLLGDAVMTS